MWHGPGKPDFNSFLPKIVFEMKTVLNRTFDFEGIGRVWFTTRAIVADMPAKAYTVCMYQHMGFFSCTFCTMKGIRHNNRMLFPVKAPIPKRCFESFNWCAKQAEQMDRPVLGIKSNSALNDFFLFS